MDSLSCKKRVRSDSDESEFNSVEVKRIREDLLEILDDSDVCTVSQDLDSFMKSFQDEISPAAPEAVVDLTSESGDSQPELGFLFEASDDELGLPPTGTTPDEDDKKRVLAETVEIGDLWGLDDQISGYDSFEYGYGYAGGDASVSNYNGNGEYVALDGLFDYTDLGFGSSDLSWRPETLPAQ